MENVSHHHGFAVCISRKIFFLKQQQNIFRSWRWLSWSKWWNAL